MLLLKGTLYLRAVELHNVYQVQKHLFTKISSLQLVHLKSLMIMYDTVRSCDIVCFEKIENPIFLGKILRQLFSNHTMSDAHLNGIK